MNKEEKILRLETARFILNKKSFDSKENQDVKGLVMKVILEIKRIEDIIASKQ